MRSIPTPALGSPLPGRASRLAVPSPRGGRRLTLSRELHRLRRLPPAAPEPPQPVQDSARKERDSHPGGEVDTARSQMLWALLGTQPGSAARGRWRGGAGGRRLSAKEGGAWASLASQGQTPGGGSRALQRARSPVQGWRGGGQERCPQVVWEPREARGDGATWSEGRVWGPGSHQAVLSLLGKDRQIW